MPLPLPNLDDRRWTDLVEEGRVLIPRYAPGWTDHNIHDPGITLIELFAWLTEANIYRLNQIPDRHRRKFLTLIGFGPRSPRSAQTVLSFSPETGTPLFQVPAGAEFEAVDSTGQPIPFLTRRDIDVSEVTLRAIQVELFTGGDMFELRDHTRDWREGLPIAILGQNPQPGAALYFGFEPLPVERPIALFLHFQGPDVGPEARERLWQEANKQAALCRPIRPDITCEENSASEPLSVALPPHHSARVVWEALTGTDPAEWTALEPVASSTRPGPGQVADDTRSLTLNGLVELNLPATTISAPLTPESDALFYVRGRLVSGAYDAPPLLRDVAPNSVVAEQAEPVFQTFEIAAGVSPGGSAPSPGATTRLSMRLDESGMIQTLTFDPAGAAGPEIKILDYQAPTPDTSGRLTLALVLVGVSDGQPEWRGQLPQSPVQVEHLQLYTHRGDSWQLWSRRDDLDASGRTDFHFVLNATTGQIRFGDGERGRVSPSDTLLLAAYHATRAEGGNVGPGQVTRPADRPGNVLWLAALPDGTRAQLDRITTNRLPASGGVGVESLAAATGRAAETLHAHERLVTFCAQTKCQTLDQQERSQVAALQPPTKAINQLDLERLALDVPGTRVARARAWAGLHPAYACFDAPGVVTLVIVPDMPGANPQPSPGLLEAVRRYLDGRRVITTRLEVVGPQYLEVRVKARVQTRPHIDANRVRDQINRALNAFLDARTGGPQGLGWPFGRDVYRSEILQLIDGIAGVDHILELSLKAGEGQERCGNVGLCPTWLVQPGRHQITVL